MTIRERLGRREQPPLLRRNLATVPMILMAVAAGAMHAWAASDPKFLNRRHAFERGETCVMTLSAPEAVSVDFAVSGWLPQTASVEDGRAEYAIDTGLLRASDYMIRARVHRPSGAVETAVFPITVAKAHDADRIPVWRWGGGGSDPEWWMQRGFTGAFTSAVRDPVGQTATGLEAYFEEATRHDFELGLYVSPLISKRWESEDSVLSLLPNGTRVGGSRPKPYPLEPAVVDYAKETAESWLRQLHSYPSLRHVMFHSEWQQPFCVNDVAVKMAQEEVGLDVREFLADDGRLKSFDASTIEGGLMDDDYPRYRFLQWWWQRGHGTALLNDMLHDLAKSHREDLITWHEPYRLAPVRYSHKGLDMIATWTYGYPDIKRLCYTTYLQAAARPEAQLVQQDITLFVYGRYAVPIGGSTADFSADFAGRDPYFTAGPDYAREAIWIVLSQRPDALCFYSAGALSPDRPGLDPFINSPETFDAIGETCAALVRPYGPTIKYCRRVPSRVAVLMSAAAAWFPTSPRLPGYPTEQTLCYATLLMMNHVPFDVLLDEDIVEGALDQYDVLVMPKADTLTRSMHDRITAFAQSGKKVIADRSLRATIEEAVITDFDFTHQLRIDGRNLAKRNAVTAEEDREIMEAYAAELAPILADLPRLADSDSPRVLTNSVEDGDVLYHFFINDDRTFGPRFGKWKLRFELGVRQTADVSVLCGENAALYDALRGRQIECQRDQGRARFALDLPPAAGTLIAQLPEPIGSVEADVPEQAVGGRPVEARFRVLAESGRAFGNVLPLRVDVVDAIGRKMEWGRFTATRDGVCRFTFTPAINDAPGTWTVRVTELISGQSTSASIECVPTESDKTGPTT